MLRSLSACVGRRGLATSSSNGLPTSAGGNDYRYDDVVRDFKWEVPQKFNFARDVVDRFATESASSTALFHVGRQETRWTFQDVSSRSKKCAAALAGLGGVKRAVLVLSRVPDWWTINVAAMRTGCVLMPGTTLLTSKDIAERVSRSGADCIIGDIETAKKVEADESGACRKIKHKILVNDDEDAAETVSALRKRGWILFSEMISAHSEEESPEPNNSASDVMQVFFTSGTTGLPKMVPHTHASYGFCHWVTGKLWLDLTPTDLHWNVADSGWAKSAWSSLLGPWSQGAGVFVHAMKQFAALDVLTVLSSYPITTLCSPPTLYRGFLQEKLTSFSFPSLRHCVSAGEPLNQEVVHAWEEATGLLIKEGLETPICSNAQTSF
jgi:acyl-coenzyme A synthetase/AMP-(fatty) acid ligase